MEIKKRVEQWDGDVRARFWSIPEEYENWTKWYLTVSVDSAIEMESEVKALFNKMFSFIKEQNIQLLQEKVYGLSSEQENILALRKQQLIAVCGDDDCLPATFIEGVPCTGGLLAGMQVIGVVPKSNQCEVKTLNVNSMPDVRVFETPLFKEIFLSGVSGMQDDAQQTLSDQTTEMFTKTEQVLAAQGLAPKNIVRTWIYFPRLLDWYGEFNKARTSWFKECNLITDTEVYLPASTGIQGKRHPNEECFMDVLGFISKDQKEADVTVLNNNRQNEADEYGSSFSRGMIVNVEQGSTLYISGTASINGEGKTIYHDDAQGQILETLLDIAALLATKQIKLNQITLATAYCKDKRTFETLKTVLDLLSLTEMPIFPVFADVCRDELLFEIDCIATKN
jgi:enamine deaminase RidA (YjgF/YER057c/UK114 family)